MFGTVLVANRGEIAVRILRTCRALGIRTVAVYSEADARSRHVTEADEAVLIGPPPASQSYLNIDAILRAARQTNADAIHPGYGFLAENAEFARHCEEAGIVFIGPPPGVIAQMGDKVRARQIMDHARVPVVPGMLAYLPADPAAAATVVAKDVGFPLLLKAAAGGGGIGMVRVASDDQLAAALEQAQRRATQAFGNGALYVERLIASPRHVEVQILGDHQGRLIHLYERECSVQRRHQKVIEESPSLALDAAARVDLTQAAVRAGAAVGYRSAGTVEFIVDREGRFYFLEMNTRLQVEHPVTEMRTGVDLVQQQIHIAAGEPLALRQDDVRPRGHAIECRIYAEDPITFYPSPGTITAYEEPTGPHIRVDGWVQAGAVVTPFYDPLLAKLIVWAEGRAEMIPRTVQALGAFRIDGVRTNIPLHLKVLAHPAFVAGRYDVSLLDDPAFVRTPA